MFELTEIKFNCHFGLKIVNLKKCYTLTQFQIKCYTKLRSSLQFKVFFSSIVWKVAILTLLEATLLEAIFSLMQLLPYFLTNFNINKFNITSSITLLKNIFDE